MSDLKKYIEKRKQNDAEFALNFDKGYQAFIENHEDIKGQKVSFIEFLATIPNVGKDSDFKRQQISQDREIFTEKLKT